MASLAEMDAFCFGHRSRRTARAVTRAFNLRLRPVNLNISQFILLGVIFNFNGMLWCHFLALSTAFAQQRLQVGQRVGLWLERCTGGLFTALGIKLALADRV